MKFKIRNTNILKTQLQKVNKIIEEVAIKFKQDGIKIMGMDSNGVLASQLFIAKDNLVGYEYESISNIAINLDAFLSILEKLVGDVEFALNKDSLTLSAGNKTFNIEFMDLDSFYEFTEFEPKVEWKVNEAVTEISKIFTYMDNGPLIINSGQDGYDLSWIVAPNFQSSH